jgi:thymidine kinase
MFSGKTEELIRRLRRAVIAKQKVIVFKPVIDDRYAREAVVSHSKCEIPAIPVKDTAEMLARLPDDVQVVGIDEVQFFDEAVVAACGALAHRGVRVIAAGLDLDYMGRPFTVVPPLMALAEQVTKLSAVCVVCGGSASRTQRVVQRDECVVIGGEGVYEARCRQHHDPHL